MFLFMKKTMGRSIFLKNYLNYGQPAFSPLITKNKPYYNNKAYRLMFRLGLLVYCGSQYPIQVGFIGVHIIPSFQIIYHLTLKKSQIRGSLWFYVLNVLYRFGILLKLPIIVSLVFLFPFYELLLKKTFYILLHYSQSSSFLLE